MLKFYWEKIVQQSALFLIYLHHWAPTAHSLHENTVKALSCWSTVCVSAWSGPLPSRKGVLGLLKAISPAPPHSPNHLWLLTAGRAPSTRPTSLHRYFLRKTYHLRLDHSADYAEAAAAPAHNPPQASTSLSLLFLFLFSLSLSHFHFL